MTSTKAAINIGGRSFLSKYNFLLAKIGCAFLILCTCFISRVFAGPDPDFAPIVGPETLTQDQFTKSLDLIRFANNTPRFNVIYKSAHEFILQMKSIEQDVDFKNLFSLRSKPVKLQRFFKLNNGRIVSLENTKLDVQFIPQASQELDVFLLQTVNDDIFIFPKLGYSVRFKTHFFSQANKGNFKLLNADNLEDYVLVRYNDKEGKIILFDKTGRIFMSKKTFSDFPVFSQDFPFFSKNKSAIDDFVITKIDLALRTDFFELTTAFFPDKTEEFGLNYSSGPRRIPFNELKLSALEDITSVRHAEPANTTTQLPLEKFRPIALVDIPNIDIIVQDQTGAEVPAGRILKSFISDGIGLALAKNWQPDSSFDRIAENIFAGILGVKIGSVALLAEPGAGKSHALEDLASRFATGRIPPLLKDYNLVFLNISALGSGNNYVGSLMTKVNALTKWAESQNGKVIIVVDEIHTLRGVGTSEGNSNDAFSYLLPALSRGDIRIVGATSAGNFDFLIAGDEMLNRRFKRVQFDSVDEVTVVVGKMKNWLEQNQVEVKFSESDLQYIVKTSNRFRTFTAQPGRSIELLEQVIGMVRARQSWEIQIKPEENFVEKSLIESAAMSLYKITAEFLNENDNSVILKNIETEFDKLEGMKETKQFLLDKTTVYLSGLMAKDKPSFRTLLLGPSGSGKTSIVRALATGMNRPFARITLGAVVNVEALKAQLSDILSKDPTAIIFLDELDDGKEDVIDALNTLLDNGEVDYVRRGNSGSSKPVAIKLNFKNNLVLAAANGAFNAEVSKPFMGMIPDSQRTSAPVYSSTQLRGIAENFLPKKIADRFDSFFLVPAAVDSEFKSALVKAVVKQFKDTEKDKETSILYKKEDIEFWAEQKTNQIQTRSYREIEKILGESLVTQLGQTLLVVNKDTQDIEVALTSQGDIQFIRKEKPMVRCQDLLLLIAK